LLSTPWDFPKSQKVSLLWSDFPPPSLVPDGREVH
jgi:hypothetical protein